jgi:hypothetical protein
MGFFNFFKPKKPKPPILWRGNCRLCNKEITSTEHSNPKNPTCLACYWGYTKEGAEENKRLLQEKNRIAEEKKQKESDDKQVALIKRAIIELKTEGKL